MVMKDLEQPALSTSLVPLMKDEGLAKALDL